MSTFRSIKANTALDRADYPDDAIFVFDFDGVVIEQDEDKLYRLPTYEGEHEALAEMARPYGINPNIYPTAYLRHFLLQARMQEYSAPHVPFLEFIQCLDDPYIVLTARSGYHAIQRVFEFCEEHDLQPQEVFCVGRVSKNPNLEMILGDQGLRTTVCYFDDSERHVANALTIRAPNLIVTHVEWEPCTLVAEGLQKKYLAPHFAG